MDFAEELRASLQNFLTGGSIEIRENSGRVTSSMPLSWEVRGAATKPLLHLWSENCNVTRRVIAIADQSEDRIALAVERFGKSKPDRLEIVRLNYLKNPKELSRMDFCEQLRRILAEQFPDESVDRLSIAPDLEHSLSRVYARGSSRHGAFFTAFLAVPDGETEDAIESSLTYALLWLDRARQTVGRSGLSTLRLILPRGKSAVLAHRLGAMDPRIALQIYERDPLRETLERVDPACRWDPRQLVGTASRGAATARPCRNCSRTHSCLCPGGNPRPRLLAQSGGSSSVSRIALCSMERGKDRFRCRRVLGRTDSSQWSKPQEARAEPPDFSESTGE